MQVILDRLIWHKEQSVDFEACFDIYSSYRRGRPAFKGKILLSTPRLRVEKLNRSAFCRWCPKTHPRVGEHWKSSSSEECTTTTTVTHPSNVIVKQVNHNTAIFDVFTGRRRSAAFTTGFVGSFTIKLRQKNIKTELNSPCDDIFTEKLLPILSTL